MIRYAIPLLPLLVFPALGIAAGNETAVPSSASLMSAMLGLVLVLGLMAGAAWMLRRFGLAKVSTASSVKIVGGVSVGNRERVIVVEVADQWIVVGVSPGRINALSTMPRQEVAALPPSATSEKTFSAWLKQTIEKRNGQ